MAVSKRTRFEVLRRDNYTCRYCRSTDNPLTVDHVTPTALGGTDNPDNLVAACRDCNAGKASTSPDEATVTNVNDDAIRWAAAIAQVARNKARAKKKRDAYTGAFDAAWLSWKFGYDWTFDRPAGWKSTIWNFYELSLPIEEVLDAVDVALGNPKIATDARWRYFCGVCWRKVNDLQDAARAILTEQEAADAP